MSAREFSHLNPDQSRVDPQAPGWQPDDFPVVQVPHLGSPPHYGTCTFSLWRVLSGAVCEFIFWLFSCHLTKIVSSAFLESSLPGLLAKCCVACWYRFTLTFLVSLGVTYFTSIGQALLCWRYSLISVGFSRHLRAAYSRTPSTLFSDC